MSNEAIITNAAGTYTQLVFAEHDDDFVGGAPATAANSLIGSNPGNVQLDLTGMATDVFWQSAKADFGATRAPLYRCDACIEFVSTFPVDGETFDFYWAASNSATPANGNATDVTGADEAYAETAGLLGQLTFIGSLICSLDAVVKGHVGFIVPTLRYGSLVVGNKTAVNTGAEGDMDETHIVLTPVTYGT
jgi:hypothetical protein